MPAEKRCSNYAGQCLVHPRVRIKRMDRIIQGDHLIIKRGLYDHHVIVKELNHFKKTLTIIHFDKPDNETKGMVVTTEKSYEDIKDYVYKVQYYEDENGDENNDEARPLVQVIDRAKDICKEFSGLGENVTFDQRYKLFSNNCEHFAYYCKLGNPKSVQVENFKRTVGSLAANGIKDLVKQLVINKRGNKMTAEIFRGGVLGASIIELGVTGEDIYRYYQMYEKGTIDREEFVWLVLNRLLVAVTTVGGAELGSAQGFVLGGPLGAVIGGLLGCIGGKLSVWVAGKSVVFGKDAVLYLLQKFGSRPHKD